MGFKCHVLLNYDQTLKNGCAVIKGLPFSCACNCIRKFLEEHEGWKCTSISNIPCMYNMLHTTKTKISYTLCHM